jgi:hypothetical protein
MPKHLRKAIKLVISQENWTGMIVMAVRGTEGVGWSEEEGSEGQVNIHIEPGEYFKVQEDKYNASSDSNQLLLVPRASRTHPYLKEVYAWKTDFTPAVIQ